MNASLSPVRFTLRDVDEAMEVGERVFYRHRVEPVDTRHDFVMELTAGRSGAMTVGLLRYGSEMAVDDIDVDGGSYAMCVPIQGTVDVRTPFSHVASTPTTAAITGPIGPIGLRGWAVGSQPVVLLKFERAALETELRRMLGKDPRGPVHFAPTLDVSVGPGLRWRQLVGLLTSELTDSPEMLWNPLMGARLTSTVMSGLLLAADHQHRAALDGRIPPMSPAAIRSATTFIDEHLHEPITTSMVASAAGLSVRALERGFARHLSTSPRRYLERARLAAAHAQLIIETPASASVSQIAADWGFAHRSRFASLYRATYGRGPFETLREN